jgi:hypothetical protein
VKIFRNLGEQIMPPAVDLNRLTASLARVAELDRQLDIALAQLTNDLPGDANAIAAAGIAFRVQVNHSASMIELGVSAVDALRRAGWTLTAPAMTQPIVVAAADANNGSMAQSENVDIPDDWTQ